MLESVRLFWFETLFYLRLHVAVCIFVLNYSELRTQVKRYFRILLLTVLRLNDSLKFNTKTHSILFGSWLFWQCRKALVSGLNF
jgi:hypothetical protein